jgi:putative tryptophan/tyrosine transport system substrate-binding protein
MRLIGLVLALCLALAPLAAEAQQAGGVRRIGFLSPSSAETMRGFVEEFQRGLRERGYVEGQNLHVEYRWAEGKADRLPGLVTDLISLRVELIVVQASPAARAAHQATRTIPIVMVGVGNPVELGLAASLARPGGNVTGFTSYGPDLTAKQLELLREAVPDMKRLAVLWTPANPLHPGTVRDLEELTRSRGIQIQPLKIVSPDELEGAFRAAATGRAAAVWVLGDSMFSVNRARIAKLAMNARLPTSFFGRAFVEAGGLMSYAPDLNHIYRQAATHVDKILKGGKPAEIPIEEPTRFELVINLKTAKALGLAIPQTLLLRADQVIQ